MFRNKKIKLQKVIILNNFRKFYFFVFKDSYSQNIILLFDFLLFSILLNFFVILDTQSTSWQPVDVESSNPNWVVLKKQKNWNQERLKCRKTITEVHFRAHWRFFWRFSRDVRLSAHFLMDWSKFFTSSFTTPSTKVEQSDFFKITIVGINLINFMIF